MTRLQWACVLGALTAFAYAGVLRAGFVYEDALWLPWAQRPEPLGLIDSIRDLPWRVFGRSALSAHLFMVAVHLLNGWLVWRIVSRWSETTAWMATGLFLLHPLQVESVAYITGGRETIACAYLLGAIAMGIDQTRRPVLRAIIVALLTSGAMLTKPSAVVALWLVPCALVLLSTPKLVLTLLPWLAGFAIAVLLPVSTYLGELIAKGNIKISPDGLWRQASTTAVALWRILALVPFPVGFTVDHDYAIASTLVRVVAVSGCVGAVVFAVVGRKTWPIASAAIAWVGLAVLPRFVIQQTDAFNEHQTLIPFLAVWVAIGAFGTVCLSIINRAGSLAPGVEHGRF